ncbi:unnamed protein product [Symbiodinium natans]|uniref:Uncharacterized protein n=1 Tax=Symbiodinium natans TaxID=878477 RepID=A0A812RNU9_9DINO|nr:unnamed protein product [Symbiodinium natans]
MVMFAIPGELVEVRIERNYSRYSEAKLLNVLEPSPDRVEPKCPLYTKCGGCQYQHLAYSAELDWKRRHVKSALEDFSGMKLPEELVAETTASPKEYHYRQKLTPRLQGMAPKGGDPRFQDVDADGPIGICAQEWGDYRDANGRRFRPVVEIEACPLATEAINAALPTAKALLRKRAARFLAPLSQAARRAASQRKRGELVSLLRQTRLDGVVCDRWNQVMTEEIPGVGKFKFAAGRFFQVNGSILPSFVRAVVDAAAASWIGEEGRPQFLIDVYCGVGLFALAGSSLFEATFGIEVDKKAVALARENAKLNSICNAKFIRGDARRGLAQVAKEAPARISTVVVDPPREGLSRETCQLLTEWRPRRVVYVSCDPATQARDLQVLHAAGYEPQSVRPFDLFPQTRHVESVLVLELPADGLDPATAPGSEEGGKKAANNLLNPKGLGFRV